MTNDAITAEAAPRAEYRDITYITGPLVFLGNGRRFPSGAILELTLATGEVRQGQVLESSVSHAVVQVLEGTRGIDVKGATVSLREESATIGVSTSLLGGGHAYSGGFFPQRYGKNPPL